MITVACPKCGLPFERHTNSQKYCKRIECVRTRYIESQRKNNRELKQDLRDMVRIRTYRPKKECRICGGDHRNYFDLCDTCRTRIIDGNDLVMQKYI